jgi:uncharacterized protein (DUF362 family)/NAD-dependent dihydropyrimidine dehydrogenase PreA subunit
MSKVYIYRGDNRFDVYHAVVSMMARYELPVSKSARIFVKPNFVHDMISVVGATTDLRIIRAVVEYLHQNGYHNISVGDGKAAGFHALGIDTMKRLGLPELAKRLSFELVDTNSAPGKLTKLSTGTVVSLPQPLLNADFVINLPKLKTHVEAKVSLGLKNIGVGCVQGIQKARLHAGQLEQNFTSVNEFIRSHIIIMDGIFAMEGNGPTRGEPTRQNMLFSSSDIVAVDSVCSTIFGYQPSDINHIRIATAKGLGVSDLRQIEIVTEGERARDPLPRLRKHHLTSPLARLFTWPPMGRLVAKIRFSRPVDWVATRNSVDWFLKWVKVRQDIIVRGDLQYSLTYDESRCTRCLDCAWICPMNYPMTLREPILKTDVDCIKCRCCAAICPSGAITLNATQVSSEHQPEREHIPAGRHKGE